MNRPTKERVDEALELTIPGANSKYEVLAAEVRALRIALADAEKRVEYAWSDGFGSAEAGESGNIDSLVKAARAVLDEDPGLYAADALAEALKPFEGS